MPDPFKFADGETVELVERNRFSKWAANKSSPRYQALKSWAEWFKARGVNAVVAKVPAKGHAVYRNGLYDEDAEYEGSSHVH